MPIIVWETSRRILCSRRRQAAELLEERLYLDVSFLDGSRPYYVQSRKCSLGTECNLAGCFCRWAYTNPDHDPFEEK